MLTLLTAATLLATTPAEAPAPRFADTHATEAHREVLQGLSRGRGQVLGLYNWASSRVTLDHDLTEPQPRQVGQARQPFLGGGRGRRGPDKWWCVGCLLYTSPSPRD